jgi:hypothetical protein
MTYLPGSPTVSTASGLTDADGILVSQAGVSKRSTLGALKTFVQTTAPATPTTPAPTPTLTVNTPAAQVAGTAFTLSGSVSNSSAMITALDFSLNNGTSWIAAPSPTITGTAASAAYSFSVTIATANSAQVIKVRDRAAQSVVGTSGAFAVNAASTSSVVTPAPNGANLLWSMGFENNITLSPLYNLTTAQGWQNFLGTDATTGFSGDPTIFGGQMQIQCLVMTGGNVATVIPNSIDTMTGHTGAQTRALHLKLAAKPDPSAQSALILFPSSAAAPSQFYTNHWLKLPADLVARVGAGGYVSCSPETKTANDFRTVFAVYVDGAGVVQWQATWDNRGDFSAPLQSYYSDYNTTVPVPLGVWFQVESFLLRHATAGRWWVKVNGQTVFDHSGPTIGALGSPLNRIFLANAYSDNPIELWVDDYQIWDKVPY